MEIVGSRASGTAAPDKDTVSSVRYTNTLIPRHGTSDPYASNDGGSTDGVCCTSAPPERFCVGGDVLFDVT